MEQKILNAIVSSTYKWRPYELAKDMELPLAEVKLHLENLRDAGKIMFENGRYGSNEWRLRSTTLAPKKRKAVDAALVIPKVKRERKPQVRKPRDRPSNHFLGNVTKKAIKSAPIQDTIDVQTIAMNNGSVSGVTVRRVGQSASGHLALNMEELKLLCDCVTLDYSLRGRCNSLLSLDRVYVSVLTKQVYIGITRAICIHEGMRLYLPQHELLQVRDIVKQLLTDNGYTKMVDLV